MIIAVVHLSDIHFISDPAKNPVSDRNSKIVSAVKSIIHEPLGACVVAVTGDVANTGQQIEYEEALNFFTSLHDELIKALSLDRLDIVFIPGNHDCNFSNSGRVREALIHDTIRGSAPDSIDGSIISECVRVQDEFFDFRALFSGMESPVATDRIYYEEVFRFAGCTIVFHCFNTAWMSEKEETQGQLLFPYHFLPDTPTEADLSIALLHHPYNWIETTNAKKFQQYVEDRCDFVLTGHEHDHSRYRKEASSGQKNEYIEGGVMQRSDEPNDSTFAAVLLDLGEQRIQNATWSWQQNLYHRSNDAAWQPFRQMRKTSRLINTEIFSAYLTDLGTGFTHPRKQKIKLSAFFVYPDLDNLSANAKGSADSQNYGTINSEELIQEEAPPRVFVMGPDSSGKTTLAKMLYVEYQRQGLTPLLIEGSALRKGYDPDKLSAVIDAAIVDQYGPGVAERLRQSSAETKVILIDNLHQSRLNRQGLSALLNNLSLGFARTTVFATDLFFFDELGHADKSYDGFLSFSIFKIREMGYKLRGKIVDAWINLGREFDSDDRSLAVAVNAAEQHITILIGKNLLPSYPIFVLTILQTYEAQRLSPAPTGSYGYYYEYLINSALQVRPLSMPIDTLYTVTGRIAFAMFTIEKRELDKEQVHAVLDEYEQLHHIPVSVDELTRILGQARILTWNHHKDYCFFPYEYVYCYFVAFYLKENAYQSTKQQDIRRVIAQLVDSIHVEQFVNILIFFVYLTKDEDTIGKLMAKASCLYSEYGPCDFDKDVQFAMRLIPEEPTVAIGDGNVAEHKERVRDQMDEVAKSEEILESEHEEQFKSGIRLNEAHKTLQALGQVLRNFPGSLSGKVKTALAQESYMLGLRVLGYLFHIIEDNMGSLKGMFKEILRGHIKWDTEQELDRRTEQFVFFLLSMLAVSEVKRVSGSVGSIYLAKTYEEVYDERFLTSMSLIDLAIKLDHFETFPINDIKKLYDEVHHNMFTSTVLRRMVVDHLYLFPVDRRLRQSVCAHLKIDIPRAKLLLGDDRKVK